MRVEVTWDDIDKGVKDNCRDCPVGRAVARAFCEPADVDALRIMVGMWRFDTPPEVVRFISAYDRTYADDELQPAFEPFAFELLSNATTMTAVLP